MVHRNDKQAIVSVHSSVPIITSAVLTKTTSGIVSINTLVVAPLFVAVLIVAEVTVVLPIIKSAVVTGYWCRHSFN